MRMTLSWVSLAEEAFALEGFAEGAGGAGELDGDPEASAADFVDVRTLDLLEAGEEVGAEFGGAVDQVSSTMTLRAARATAQASGIAAEGAAVIAGMKTPRTSRRGEHGRDGIEAAGEAPCRRSPRRA